jgi:DNA-directed RNA polymerase specialized sigma24 family protein
MISSSARMVAPYPRTGDNLNEGIKRLFSDLKPKHLAAHRRKLARRQLPLDDEDANKRWQALAESPNAEQIILRHICYLSPRQEEAIRLLYGISRAATTPVEAAQIMRCSRATVDTHRLNGLIRLADVIVHLPSDSSFNKARIVSFAFSF